MTGSSTAGRSAETGFTYIGLLVGIAIIGGALAAVGQVWSTESQREREAELLYRGDTIRKAIAAYMYSLGGNGQYPRELQDLVQDPRSPDVKRYLRRIYEDPMTGQADWTLIRGPDGGIMGVASTSQAAPLKLRGFDVADEFFKDAKCYCDWQFMYIPQTRRGLPAPAPSPGPGSSRSPTPPGTPYVPPTGPGRRPR